MISSGLITFTPPPSPDDSSSGDPAQRRCVRVKQDNSKRTRCPGGSSDMMALLKRIMGIPLASGEQPPADGVFRVPIISQDDGQGHSISINNGTVGEPIEALTRYNETVFTTPSDWTASGEGVELELAGKLDFAPERIWEARLIGSARDASGAAIFGAAVRISGTKLTTSTACHAQLAISYDAYTTTRNVTVSPDDTQDDHYNSSLTVISACGGVERVNVEVPRCFQDFWGTWGKFLEEWRRMMEGGDVDIISSDKEVRGGDPKLDWNLCGNHLLKGDSLGLYDHLAQQGEVCYPGILCRDKTLNCLPDGEEED